MADPTAGLRSELESRSIAERDFPIWTAWGVGDESLSIHSLGMSYLVRVGQELGYVAACEYPVAGHDVRADAVWWDRNTRAPVALFEFERYKDGSELTAKVRNLMRGWHGCGQAPSLLVLVFWQKDFFSAGSEQVTSLWRELERGFQDASGTAVDPVPARLLRIYECLHNAAGGTYTLKRFQEWRRS